jgi:hypothetical protein
MTMRMASESGASGNRQHTSAYVSIRQHTSAFLQRGVDDDENGVRERRQGQPQDSQTLQPRPRNLREHELSATDTSTRRLPAYVSIRQHTSAYVSIRQSSPPLTHLPADCQHTSAYVSIRQHTSRHLPADCQHTSAYATGSSQTYSDVC